MNRNYYQTLISMSMQQTDYTGKVAFDIQGSSFSIKTSGSGSISWGDGELSFVSGTNTTTSHTYLSSGTHSLVFTGSFTNIQQVDATQAAKVTNVLSYSLPSLTSAYSAFSNCSNASFDGKFAFGSSITSFNRTFMGCVGLSFTPQFPNTSVTSFSNCFKNCTGITVAAVLPSIVMSSSATTDLSSMYDGCTNLKEITSSHRRITPNGKDMDYMFRNCSRLIADITDIVGNYTTTGITSTGRIKADQTFYNCSNLMGKMHSWWSNATKFNSHIKCFYKCTGLSNYSSIPQNWKTS